MYYWEDIRNNGFISLTYIEEEAFSPNGVFQCLTYYLTQEKVSNRVKREKKKGEKSGGGYMSHPTF